MSGVAISCYNNQCCCPQNKTRGANIKRHKLHRCCPQTKTSAAKLQLATTGLIISRLDRLRTPLTKVVIMNDSVSSSRQHPASCTERSTHRPGP